MYLHDEHWKRVELQLEPMLGYYFTLDPLGFKGDQYLALFSVLGQMLTMKSKGVLNSDYHAWLIQDMTHVCARVMKLALNYLKSGAYAMGKLRADLVDQFVASPACRTREVIPNLMTVLGWYHIRDVGGSISTDLRHRFVYAYLEEAMRRCFTREFHATPYNAEEWVAKLLYGTASLGPAEDEAIGARAKVSDALEKQFATYFKYKLKLLSKKNHDIAHTHFVNGPPAFEQDAASDIEKLKTLIVADDDKVKSVVDDLCSLIRNDVQHVMRLFDPVTALSGHAHHDINRFVDGSTLRYMCIQAMLYCRNAYMNTAVDNNSYINLYDAQINGTTSDIVSKTHEDYQKRLVEKTGIFKQFLILIFRCNC